MANSIRLCKTLKNFATHVQYSVFEAELSQKQIAQMKEAVKKVIKPDEDLVRYYHLCDACKRRISMTQGFPRGKIDWQK